jgi:hypothetical protein
MIRRNPDVIAIALLVVILAAVSLVAPHFAPFLAPFGNHARNEISLVMHEAIVVPRAEIRREIGKAHQELLRESEKLRRELAELPSCPTKF